MKFKDILSEMLTTYSVRVIVMVETKYNRTDIFNKMRGLPGVILVEPENNEFLNSKQTDRYGFSLLKIKFLAPVKPIDDIKNIRSLAMQGGNDVAKIPGLVKFIIKKGSLESQEQ